MHSKQKIVKMLEDAGVKPVKRLGQRFLIDLNLMRLLVDSADISKEDIVLEVGCATGSLTEELAERAGLVIAVEIDAALAKIAQTRLADKKNVKIIKADILEAKNTVNPIIIEEITKAKTGSKGRLLLVANLPYNIASPLMLNLVVGDIAVDDMYVTVQKEVAERITAGPKDKQYGAISILLNAAGDCKIIRRLPPSVFWPQPKVDSSMVSFIRNKRKIEQIDDISVLSQIVKLFMRHRRKMLKSIVKLEQGSGKNTYNWQLIFEKSGIDPEKRPDNLTVEQYVILANTCWQSLDLKP